MLVLEKKPVLGYCLDEPILPVLGLRVVNLQLVTEGADCCKKIFHVKYNYIVIYNVFNL